MKYICPVAAIILYCFVVAAESEILHRIIISNEASSNGTVNITTVTSSGGGRRIPPGQLKKIQQSEFGNSSSTAYNKWQTYDVARPPKTKPKFANAKSPYIVTGSAAVSGQFPYQVGIVLDNTFFCGGSLISVTWVLTAAHCVYGKLSAVLILGTTNITSPTRVLRTSRNFTYNPHYNARTLENDIAVILVTALTLNTNIQLVRLPTKSQMRENTVGYTAIVSGWGKTNDSSSSISIILMFIYTSVLNADSCKAAYGPLPSSVLCTSVGGNSGTCNGDSGGPLVARMGDNEITQIGVVSFGSAMGCVTAPNVFSRVTSFMSWITFKTGVQQSSE